ncbi:FecR family protein [Chitinophaga lutea]
MRKEDFIVLSTRIADGTASQEEVALYNAYYDEMVRQGATAALPDGEALLVRVHERIAPRGRVRTMRRWWAAAAAVIVVATAAGTWMYSRSVQQPGQRIVSVSRQDAAPAGNKAYLTLADGSRIELEGADTGRLAMQAGFRVTKTASGEIVYESDTTLQPSDATLKFNVLSTPRGGQFRLLLPDGSKVWLNAASALRFPAAFAAGERRVELNGEAYFEIAKDAGKPFIVVSEGQEVKVLGTHFNVQAYGDEPGVRTTLLEGKVEVAAAGGKRMLAPGEQCRLVRATGAMRTLQIDPEEAVAWRNGYFVFNETRLRDVVLQLCRWYNVEADFDRLPNVTFNGVISREVPLSKVLEMLEETGGVPLKLDRQQITTK